MESKNVTCKSDSEDIRIYIDNILHVRIPRDNDLKLQSWVEGNTKTYVIELVVNGHSDQLVYDNKNLWVQVLKVLDENI